ncbi:hypothetical protein GW17_00061631, partial [Ensete ventricosum]
FLQGLRHLGPDYACSPRNYACSSVATATCYGENYTLMMSRPFSPASGVALALYRRH